MRGVLSLYPQQSCSLGWKNDDFSIQVPNVVGGVTVTYFSIWPFQEMMPPSSSTTSNPAFTNLSAATEFFTAYFFFFVLRVISIVRYISENKMKTKVAILPIKSP